MPKTNHFCRCCMGHKKLTDISESFEEGGKMSVYSEVIYSCFAIDVLEDFEDKVQHICDVCIKKLKEAANFKKQILAIKSLIQNAEGSMEIKPIVKVDIKDQPKSENCSDDDDDEFDSRDAFQPEMMYEMPIEQDEIKGEVAIIENPPLPQTTTRDPNAIKNKLKQITGLVIKPVKKQRSSRKEMNYEESDDEAFPEEDVTIARIEPQPQLEPEMEMEEEPKLKPEKRKLERKKEKAKKMKPEKEIPNPAKVIQSKRRRRSFEMIPYELDRVTLTCKICAEKFRTLKTLDSHMNIHYPRHICDHCGKGFVTSQRLRNHLVSHDYGEFKCLKCEQVFDTKIKLATHTKLKHHAQGKFIFACPKCPERFKNFTQRIRHLAEVHQENMPVLKCDYCDHTFHLKGPLNAHVKQVHLKIKKHICPDCGMGFQQIACLKKHMVKHTGEKNFKCNVCGKAYGRKFTLTEHMKIHSNDRKYSCTDCGRTFTQKCTLKGHMKLHGPESKMEMERPPMMQEGLMTVPYLNRI